MASILRSQSGKTLVRCFIGMGGNEGGTIRVVVADDHALVRAGLRLMLHSLGGVEVVGETGDGRDALNLVRKHKPDLALLDVTMPGLTGIELAGCIQKELPRTRVIILSMHTNEEYVVRAVRAGAAGYLLKHSDPVELELAIEAVLAG